jgi:hypothetical protein
MSKQVSLSALFSLQFAQLPDETNPGVIECYCSLCNRLIAASREKRILEIAQRKHTCAASLTAEFSN